MHDAPPAQALAAVRGYRIERFIGAGGMAAVYEARRLGASGPGERVACKVMHEGPAGQAADPAEHARRKARRRELARQEAVLGLRITAGHPNLVQILDYFDDARGPEGRRCIVMELVDGANVAELRGPDRRLPFPVTRRIACEVLEALVYLHGLGVLHRARSAGRRAQPSRWPCSAVTTSPWRARTISPRWSRPPGHGARRGAGQARTRGRRTCWRRATCWRRGSTSKGPGRTPPGKRATT